MVEVYGHAPDDAAKGVMQDVAAQFLTQEIMENIDQDEFDLKCARGAAKHTRKRSSAEKHTAQTAKLRKLLSIRPNGTGFHLLQKAPGNDLPNLIRPPLVNALSIFAT